jgi:hypothetical protein
VTIKNKHFTINSNKNDKNDKNDKNYLLINLKNNYSKIKKHREDYYQFINHFSTLMESILGKGVSIEQNNEQYIFNNVYIIDHDHHGYPLKKKLFISDNKINIKKNHTFFNKNVIYFTNHLIGNIDVYYDENTKIILGYKEKNKDYQKTEKIKKFMIVNYSLFNIIKYFGYEKTYINVKDIASIIKEQTETGEHKLNNNDILKKIIFDISKMRILNLKSLMREIVILLNRIKYGKLIDNLSKKYHKNLQKIIIGDVFAKWKEVEENIHFENIHFENIGDKSINIDINSEYVDVEEISNYDYHGNLILYYIIKELEKLFEINNKNNYFSNNLAHMIIKIINNSFEKNNNEKILTNFDMRKFKYIVESKSYTYQDENIIVNSDGFKFAEDEVDKEIIEMKEDLREEQDAIDVEHSEDIDYGNVDYANE